MLFEFLCPTCEATNILKNIKGLPEKRCRKCDGVLSVAKDLIRFERDKSGDIEILIHERVERLARAMDDFAERLGRLETIILDDRDDKEMVTVN